MAENEASRRYFAAAREVSRELQQRAFGGALWRAVLVIVPVAFIGGVVGGFFGVTDELGPGNPATTIAVAGALLLVYVVAYAILLWHALGDRLGAALDVIEWSDRETRAEWAAASPGSSVPRSPGQARRWLDTHPESDANRPQRALASIMIGDVEGARDALTRYPVDTAFQRHQRAADGLGVDIVEGRVVSAAELDEANRELEPEHRHHAAVCRATSEAVVAVLSSGDWQASLARARQELPEAAIDIGRRKVWLVFVAVQVVVTTLVVGIGLALWLLVLS